MEILTNHVQQSLIAVVWIKWFSPKEIPSRIRLIIHGIAPGPLAFEGLIFNQSSQRPAVGLIRWGVKVVMIMECVSDIEALISTPSACVPWLRVRDKH
jgi:hypothetical protein